MYVLELDEFKGKMSNCLGFFIFKKKDVAIIKLIFFSLVWSLSLEMQNFKDGI